MTRTAALSRWVLLNVVAAFSLYWISNLLLWLPWSLSAALGITMMLTVAPIVWAVGIYQCLMRFPGQRSVVGASLNAAVFLVVAAVMDLAFFGVIRGAMEELLHPTTFAGYAFLVVLPFAEVVVLRRRLGERVGTVTGRDLRLAAWPGAVALLVLALIIL